MKLPTPLVAGSLLPWNTTFRAGEKRHIGTVILVQPLEWLDSLFRTSAMAGATCSVTAEESTNLPNQVRSFSGRQPAGILGTVHRGRVYAPATVNGG